MKRFGAKNLLKLQNKHLDHERING